MICCNVYVILCDDFNESTCFGNWTLNATGPINGTFLIGVVGNSSNLGSFYTDFREITILDEALN